MNMRHFIEGHSKMFSQIVISFLLLYLLGAQSVEASNRISQICDGVSYRVAAETSVPVEVLLAITRTETGRNLDGKVSPWPWTVNMEGKGVWFDSEDKARSFVFSRFKGGARSFDVGCFQINYKWHGHAFKSIDEMFNPLLNARYAATFLEKLYMETGNWSDAAGLYHSRTAKHSSRYKEIFNQYLVKMQNVRSTKHLVSHAAPYKPAPRKGRSNRFPLLQSEGTLSQLGSLVPLTSQSSIPALFSLSSKNEGS